MELSCLKFKKFQERIFRARKMRKSTMKKFLIYKEIELSSLNLKKLPCFMKELAKLEKSTSHISG